MIFSSVKLKLHELRVIHLIRVLLIQVVDRTLLELGVNHLHPKFNSFYNQEACFH